MNLKDKQFIQEAIKLSFDSVKQGGGPFGAVIVKQGKIIAGGTNKVTLLNDPTAHAEIIAIREAAKKLNSFDLSGCELYASCEPCPMCLSAIYWSGIDKIYFANTTTDAGNAGFDDSFIYKEIQLPYKKRKIPTFRLLDKEAILAFKEWREKEDKIEY